MQTLKTDTEILIAGAGPTGLALAAELRRQGTDALVIDRQPAGANTSRACVVHARTLEVLEPLGVTADLLERGVKVPIFRVRDRDHSLITIDFSELPSPYPFTLMCPQDRVEQCLDSHLEQLGGSVTRPCELIHFEMSEDSHIDVLVRTDGAEKTIKPQWLIGCDGMHSKVREQSGVAFDGGEYEQGFVLADVHMDWPLSREEVTLFFSPAGLVVVAPLPDDHYRIVATAGQRAGTAVSSLCPASARRARPHRETGAHPRHRVEFPIPYPSSCGEKSSQRPNSPLRRRSTRPQPSWWTGHEYGHSGQHIARPGSDRNA